ncbi:MAG TPA: glycosyltransferase family 4 protein [Anaerolineales bacterium]|nr:glycosyltransferase family 4 protein [Anaerolineales bacterium]
MHILLLHQLFIRTDDAGGTRHVEFCRHLAEAGHQVTILAGTRSYLTGEIVSAERREVLAPGIEIVRCGTLPGGQRNFVRRAIGFIYFTATSLLAGVRLGRIDLVWATSPPLLQVASAWVLAGIRRAPWVFEVRDLWPAFAVAVGVLRHRLLIRLSEWLERFLYRRADRLIVNSPGFRDHLTAAGVDDDRIVLVANGVDPQMFNPRDEGRDFRSRSGLGEKFVALYAGAHGLSNDLAVVLEAADLLKAEDDIVFVFVGDGGEKARLEQQAQNRGLPNVVFLPPVPKDEIPSVLAGCDCGIAILKPLPLYATTYPNKVFDYMAAGRPVVLAIDGVIREVVEGEGAGVAVGPGNPQAMAQAVRRLARDRETARAMGRRGRDAVERRFDRRDQARALEATFRQVAAEAAR